MKRAGDSRPPHADRLQEVMLFGSWVRGEAHEESDVDLLVVLDEVAYRARERDRIAEALFDLEADSRRAKPSRRRWRTYASPPVHSSRPRSTRVFFCFGVGRDERQP